MITPAFSGRRILQGTEDQIEQRYQELKSSNELKLPIIKATGIIKPDDEGTIWIADGEHAQEFADQYNHGKMPSTPDKTGLKGLWNRIWESEFDLYNNIVSYFNAKEEAGAVDVELLGSDLTSEQQNSNQKSFYQVNVQVIKQ